MVALKMARVSSISVCICAVVAQLAVASTLYQINATGPAVVLQAIATLQQSGVFGNDNEILRQIAYVETRDGKLTILNDGGIWAVRADKFLLIQNLENISIHLSEQIQNSFGINWTSVQWRDLRIPLYSAITARLVLYTSHQVIFHLLMISKLKPGFGRCTITQREAKMILLEHLLHFRVNACIINDDSHLYRDKENEASTFNIYAL